MKKNVSLESLQDVMGFFGAETINQLSNQFNKATYFIGALKLHTKEEMFIVSNRGDGITDSQLNGVIAMSIEGLVNETDETINSRLLTFPFTETSLETEMDRMDELCNSMEQIMDKAA